MTPTPQLPIPATAWEQAAIVAIFAVVFVALVVYVFSWQAKQQKSWQEFQQKEAATWQHFIHEQNTSWKEWMERTNLTTGKALEDVSAALRELRCTVETHDEKVEQRVNEIKSAQGQRAARK